jgi:two-component system nitrogen regulation response regulator NtrX
VKPRVLVVDDEEAVRSSLRMIFDYEGYEVLLAANGPAGLKMAEQEGPDLVILDIKMPQMDGLEVLKRLKAEEPSPPVVVLSGHGTVKTGAFDFIEKPPESERILIVARNALGQKRLVDENRRLKLSFDDRYRMVGVSPALEKVWDAIRRAAPTNATVLLTGESGVGKELAARAIHSNSLRQDEAFIQVNCAAIPEELIESEELAHRGTIFLDEVGDMSLRTQAKVLRVLQEGEVERLGSQKTIQVDVRVIAATNKTLEEEIEAGRFREDLYFRLSVLPIRVPPLRERPEDVEPLIEHLVREFCTANNFRAKSFAPAAMEALKRHRWRGNVRELKNAVERLLIMVEADEVSVDDIAGVLRQPSEDASALNAAGTLRDFKEAAERAFLVAKLRENNWNISGTAQAIGTPRSNLYKKLDQYGISQETDG